MRERNDKRRVGYSERDPHSADARFDKGLSTGMLSPFFAWTQKCVQKKFGTTLAQPRCLSGLAGNFILGTGCHATRRATQLCGESSAHFRCADRKRLHYVRRAGKSTGHPSSDGLDYSSRRNTSLAVCMQRQPSAFSQIPTPHQRFGLLSLNIWPNGQTLLHKPKKEQKVHRPNY